MSTELDRFLDDRQNRRLFEQERLILEITEAICGLMNERGVSRGELAQKLACSPSNISQILDGENNFTARTIADTLFELDARLTVAAEPLRAPDINQVFEVEVKNSAYDARADVRYSHYSHYSHCQTTSDSATGDYPLAA
jgi:transcriptional regulator with XRE-family HTH domain